jgi:hypothetical protein
MGLEDVDARERVERERRREGARAIREGEPRPAAADEQALVLRMVVGEARRELDDLGRPLDAQARRAGHVDARRSTTASGRIRQTGRLARAGPRCRRRIRSHAMGTAS